MLVVYRSVCNFCRVGGGGFPSYGILCVSRSLRNFLVQLVAFQGTNLLWTSVFIHELEWLCWHVFYALSNHRPARCTILELSFQIWFVCIESGIFLNVWARSFSFFSVLHFYRNAVHHLNYITCHRNIFSLVLVMTGFGGFPTTRSSFVRDISNFWMSCAWCTFSVEDVAYNDN